MTRFFLFSLLVSCSSLAWAECAREDVDHYLSKGFTPDQIVQLCGSKKEEPVEPSQTVESESPEQNIQAVKTIDAGDLPDYATIFKIQESKITGNTWRFSTTEKIKYGEKDVFGRYPEIEVVVNHEVDIASLRIVKRKARIPFIRGAEILVSAKLQHEIVTQDEVKPQAKLAIDAFEADELANDAFSLVVRKSVSLDKADLALSKILP